LSSLELAMRLSSNLRRDSDGGEGDGSHLSGRHDWLDGMGRGVVDTMLQMGTTDVVEG
jgi:hypothetical protein